MDDELLIAYFKGEVSDEEAQQITEWIEAKIEPRITTPNSCTNRPACRNNAGRRIQGMAELRQHSDLPLEI